MSFDLPVPSDLHNLLLARGLVPERADWRILEGGRTNRVWQVAGIDGDLVCKLFGQDDDNPLYPNLPEAEFATLSALQHRQLAPEPVALLSADAGRLLVYRKLQGTRWQIGVNDVAALLARLHSLKPAIQLRRLPSGSKALARQINEIAALCQGHLPAVSNLAPNQPVPPITAPALIHTDVVSSNLIATPKGLRLIDWQCPAFGDPCEDLASFLSPAMQSLYGAGPLGQDRIDRFLQSYPDQTIVMRYRELAPLFHLRIAAYCRWKMENGDPDYAEVLDLELSAIQ